MQEELDIERDYSSPKKNFEKKPFFAFLGELENDDSPETS